MHGFGVFLSVFGMSFGALCLTNTNVHTHLLHLPTMFAADSSFAYYKALRVSFLLKDICKCDRKVRCKGHSRASWAS